MGPLWHRAAAPALHSVRTLWLALDPQFLSGLMFHLPDECVMRQKPCETWSIISGAAVYFFFFTAGNLFFSIIERGLIAFSHFEKFARVALSPNTRTSLAAPPYFHEFLCSTVNGAFAIRELASHPSNPLGFH